jgi:hypothetical protein
MKTFRLLVNIVVLPAAILMFAFFFSQCELFEDDEVERTDPGTLEIAPQEALVSVSTTLTAYLKVLPGIEISDTVRLVKVISNGDESEIGFLLDNGDLSNNADEIKGDKVFSGKFYVTEFNKGEVKFKAVASSKGSTDNKFESELVSFNVYADINGTDMNALFAIQETAVTQLTTYLNGSQDNIESAVDQLVQWLKSQPEISTVEQEGITSIEIKYKSGLMGGIIISLLGDDGLSDTRGGLISEGPQKAERAKTSTIPLSKQTRGINMDEYKTTRAFDPNTIGNRNVFIYAAFEAAWRNNERPHIINILDSLECGDFPVNFYTNQEANVARLYEMTSYGMVVLATHGSGGGKAFLTGEIADTTLDVYQTYKPMMQGANPKMGISKNMTISKVGTVVTKQDVYKVYASFITALPGEFPQSVILNNACGSDKTPPLRDAFLGKGAKTYYGYTESVDGAFCVPVARDVFITLAKNGKKTGEVSKINTTSPDPPNPTFKIQGSPDMHFALQLINGNFEEGVLGWTRNGDGRVISQLGFISPEEGSYMGIISTGLGYTTETGKISQSFNVPSDASGLTLQWNFLSEEFLEFIGSSYQDTYELVLQSEEFGEEILFSRTIDGIASEFGASAPSEEIPEGIPGELIAVSPDIVFDQGGVYMTGWQTFTYDLSAYKGKCVTLVLRCTDVGDSIYDSAILLDNIIIN